MLFTKKRILFTFLLWLYSHVLGIVSWGGNPWDTSDTGEYNYMKVVRGISVEVKSTLRSKNLGGFEIRDDGLGFYLKKSILLWKILVLQNMQ